MEQNTENVPQPAPVNPKLQRIEEIKDLRREDFGHVERTVRALVGVPLVLSFTYIRHFYFALSLVLLAVGLYFVGTSVFHYCLIRHWIYWFRWKRPAS